MGKKEKEEESEMGLEERGLVRQESPVKRAQESGVAVMVEEATEKAGEEGEKKQE